MPQRKYEHPIEIADGIHWVGFHEKTSNLHCNPYLIVGGRQAVVIDAGSRPDFAVVMMKILQTGVSPQDIAALIYQHPDPDLCGSMSNMVDICRNADLQILSDPGNNVFLSYYIEREKRGMLRSIVESGFEFTFGGRTLLFYRTPYAHCEGSFITYDGQTKTLFGSMGRQWDLFVRFDEACYTCPEEAPCPVGRSDCPLGDILAFHRHIMPSEKALHQAMEVVGKLDVRVIAPQHGGIFTEKRDIDFVIGKLAGLRGVGIDALR